MTGRSLMEVERYLEALSRVRDAVRRAHPDAQGLVRIFQLYRSRVIGKTGVVIDEIEYDVHGAGCLFIEDGGAEIDIDFLEGGAEVFDHWRIRRFSVSVGAEFDGSPEDIAAACRKLVSLGRLTEPRNGWFSPT